MPFVPRQGRRQLARCRVPQPHGLVPGSRGDPRAVRAEGNGPHAVLVPRQGRPAPVESRVEMGPLPATQLRWALGELALRLRERAVP